MSRRPILSGYRVGKDTGGPECEALEREIEAMYGVRHARVFNSATSALHASLVALGVDRNDPVNVPVYSMSASATCVLHAGGLINFCDITEGYTLEWLAANPAHATVLVHLFGHHADVPDGWTGPVVHDCAQSPTYGMDRRLPPTQIAVYSLNQWKVCSSGEGGYAVTNDDRVADRLHAVRNHGECRGDILGWNYRMTEPIAAVARGELSELLPRMEARRDWALKKRMTLDLPDDPGNRDWFLYPARVGRGREVYATRVGGQVGYHRLICDLPYFRARRYPTNFPVARAIENSLVVIHPLAEVNGAVVEN